MLKLIKYKRIVLLGWLTLIAAAFAVTEEFFVVAVSETRTYFVSNNSGSEYFWTVFTDPDFIVPAPASEAYFPNGNTGHDVDIEWRKEGLFYVAVAEYDLSGCMNIKVKAVRVNPGGFTVSAGNDTIIGQCHPFQLRAVFNIQEGLTYTCQWEPAELLDDPSSVTPVFTPGSSTRFTVTVTNSLGVTVSNAVQITVSNVLADAGQNVLIYSGETAELDGSGSTGEGLEYQWSAGTGIILSGAVTANPVIQGTGSYMLRVTDRFGCEDSDTVNVGMLTHQPVVFNDYDTTEYRTAHKIDILDNDHDPDDLIDRTSLRISVPPVHGVANIDFTDHSIVYVPGRNFSGTDQLTYLICDRSGNCYEAIVYVVVNDFRFVIPEAFSPNNDGINDDFEIQGIEYYEGNSIEIFNRWGSRVYRADNYGISTWPLFWDGKSHTGARIGNETLPSGTYFYVLDLGNGEKRITGSVYLDR